MREEVIEIALKEDGVGQMNVVGGKLRVGLIEEETQEPGVTIAGMASEIGVKKRIQGGNVILVEAGAEAEAEAGVGVGRDEIGLQLEIGGREAETGDMIPLIGRPTISSLIVIT